MLPPLDDDGLVRVEVGPDTREENLVVALPAHRPVIRHSSNGWIGGRREIVRIPWLPEENVFGKRGSITRDSDRTHLLSDGPDREELFTIRRDRERPRRRRNQERSGPRPVERRERHSEELPFRIDPRDEEFAFARSDVGCPPFAERDL